MTENNLKFVFICTRLTIVYTTVFKIKVVCDRNNVL